MLLPRNQIATKSSFFAFITPFIFLCFCFSSEALKPTTMLFSRRTSSSLSLIPTHFRTFSSRPLLATGREIGTVLELDLTGKRVDISWTPARLPVPAVVEKDLARVLILRGEFRAGSQLNEKRVAEITATLEKIGGHITFDQAVSLRKQLLVEKIINTSDRMWKSAAAIRKAYETGSDILALSKRFDLPPVAILRNIITYYTKRRYRDLREHDVKDLVKLALKGEGEVFTTLLSARDKKQIDIAKVEDQTSFASDVNERLISAAWEESLYTFLNTTGVSYISETALIEAKSKSTPDCVFLDDLYINNRLVRWIDMKCFYGSDASAHFTSKLSKQVQRYEEEFKGPGAIIYKLGHSEALPQKVQGALFLDEGPLDVGLVERLRQEGTLIED